MNRNLFIKICLLVYSLGNYAQADEGRGQFSAFSLNNAPHSNRYPCRSELNQQIINKKDISSIASVVNFINPNSKSTSQKESNFEFAPLIQNHCTVGEVATKAKTELKTFMSTAYYDRTVYHLETDVNPMNSSSQDNNAQCNFDSLKTFDKHGTGNCIGFSRFFGRQLNASIGTRFQIIASTIPTSLKQDNMPEYTHTALLLWCNDGYILIDPGLNISEPVVLKSGKSTSVDLGNRGIWKFELDGQRIHVSANSGNKNSEWSNKQKKDSEYHYKLEELKNPDVAILPRHYLNDRKVLIYPLTAPAETSFRMIINLDKKRIEYSKTDPDGKVTYLFSLNFEEYLKDQRVLNKYLTKEVAQELRLPSNAELISRVKNVLDRANSSTLKNSNLQDSGHH